MNTKLDITNDGGKVSVHILACTTNASDTIPHTDHQPRPLETRIQNKMFLPPYMRAMVALAPCSYDEDGFTCQLGNLSNHARQNQIRVSTSGSKFIFMTSYFRVTHTLHIILE